MKKPARIAILGGGAWGCALAVAAARSGNQARLWLRDPVARDEINEKASNQRYLPGIRLDPAPKASLDAGEALEGAAIALLAIPAQAVAQVAQMIAPLVEAKTVLVSCAKGIDRNAGNTPCAALAEAMPEIRLAALSGPSFAVDAAKGLPTAVTLASEKIELSKELSAILSGPSLRCYASDDLLGVELAGALKNVIALAVGAARSMKLGASAEAALSARGFREMSRLAQALGAKRETMTGLAGLGDLMLTCSGPKSRNFERGMALGEGKTRYDRLSEGAFSASVAVRLARGAQVETPIIDAVDDALAGRAQARDLVARLLERPLRSEAE